MAKKKRNEFNFPPEEVSIEHNGKTYSGHFRLMDGGIKVTSDIGSKWASLGALPAHLLARMLLAELAAESSPK